LKKGRPEKESIPSKRQDLQALNNQRNIKMTRDQFAISDEERRFLTHLLKFTLGESRVEERRTDSPAFKDMVVHEEHLIRNLLAKLEAASLCKSTSGITTGTGDHASS
jgi:hypothetical protein